MSTEQDKALVELAVFSEFVSKANLPVRLESIRKLGKHSEPDIFCTMNNGEEVAFELVEICADNLASLIAKLRNGGTATTSSTFDPTENILRKKLHKTYKTQLPIELLCYTNGRVVTPDDRIIAVARSWADAIESPFRKVWLLGEKEVYEIWQAS